MIVFHFTLSFFGMLLEGVVGSLLMAFEVGMLGAKKKQFVWNMCPNEIEEHLRNEGLL